MEIERFESFIGLGLFRIVRNQKFAADEMDVGFHAAETVSQRVEERTRVEVIVMGVSVGQRRLRATDRGEQKKGEDHAQGAEMKFQAPGVAAPQRKAQSNAFRMA